MNTIEYGQGAVNNTIGWGQGAKVGSSFSNTKSILLDGVDDFCETSSVYSELDSQNNFAFSFWIKPTTLSGVRVILGIGNSAADSRAQQFQIWSYQNRIYFYLNSMSFFAVSNANTVNVDQWQHVLITRDSGRPINDKVRIYINGVNELSSENTRFWSNTTNATTELYIGEHTEGYQSAFLGFIDEFAIYKQDMADYITEIYSSGSVVDLNALATAPNPTTWYRMGDGDTSPTIQDKNGSANLTMTNFSTFSTDVPT